MVVYQGGLGDANIFPVSGVGSGIGEGGHGVTDGGGGVLSSPSSILSARLSIRSVDLLNTIDRSYEASWSSKSSPWSAEKPIHPDGGEGGRANQDNGGTSTDRGRGRQRGQDGGRMAGGRR